MYEFVNVLGGVMPTDFFPQCFMKACRTGRLNFHPTSCIHSRHYLAFKLRDSERHMSSSFSFLQIATKVKENWLIWLDVLWFLNQDSCLNHFVCLLVLNFQNLCRQTQTKPENTVYLSTFANFCGILQSCRLCCCAFNPFFVSWVTLRRKITA